MTDIPAADRAEMQRQARRALRRLLDDCKDDFSTLELDSLHDALEVLELAADPRLGGPLDDTPRG